MGIFLKKNLYLLSILLMTISGAMAQTGQPQNTYVLPEISMTDEREFNTYEVPRIETTGIPECDMFLSQVEICMKAQIPASEYADLERGLNESRPAIFNSTSRRDVDARQQCTQAFEEFKREYTPRGCVFN